MTQKTAQTQQISLALVGAPNCGKTALFNALTGARAKVANYPGVTVERRYGAFSADKRITVIDLPGTYGLRVTSPDEAVTRDVLLGQISHETPPDVVVAVMDATNLRLSLRMVLELKVLGKPMLVALNLSDVAQARGLKIDVAKLSAELGLPVIETVAIKKKGMQALNAAILAQATQKLAPSVASTDSAAALADKIAALDSDVLYAEVERVMQQSVQENVHVPGWHSRLDQFVMHPFWGVLCLLLTLFVIFQAVFSWAEPVMELIELTIGALGGWIGALLPDGGLLQSLVVDGIIAGVGSVLVFLPQIVILFAFILLLEDSGYLPRAAFLFDKIMRHMGLSGRSFIPLLSSFACAIPAVMATRTIQNPRERLATITIAPLMTCSARLPVYALIIGAVIPKKIVFGFFNLQGVTLFVLYLMGILSSIIVALIMKRQATKAGHNKAFPLQLELPSYRMPDFKNLIINLFERVKIFLMRAGTIIFALVVLLWFLATFPGAPEGATLPAIDYSFAGSIGHFIQPLFAPLGFSWQMCISLIPGMAAREVVVGALGTVYAISASSDALISESLVPIIKNSWSLPTAFAFLTWYVYAPQCLATLAVIRRETNSLKHTLYITAYLFVLAYVMGALVYQLTGLLL